MNHKRLLLLFLFSLTVASVWADHLTNSYLAKADAVTATSVTSTLNPSFTGNNVTITATVTSGGNPVTLGAVSFFEGAQVLATNVSLNASGQASFTKSNWAEGSHLVTANYSGATGFNTSTGTLTQVVNNTTTVNGNTFCNTASGITINDNAAATPYPSNIFVTGLSGTISSITVDLKGLTHPSPSEIDLLLVSPTGQKFVLMSGVGGANTVNNANITLSDAAASSLPNTLISGTFKPTSSNANPTFPSPAPASPYSQPAPTGSATLSSVFSGVSPNGTWQLYVVDDAAVNSGWITGGWCLNFTMSCTNSIAYVNTSVASSGDGTTWATAFKTLQEALTAANNCASITQIWVAKGTYYPDEGGSFADNDRNASFSMKNGLTIYGGFVGNEPSNYDLSLRNFTTNATILSGDIDKNSTLDNGNSYHVINNPGGLTNTAILDGFTLTGGNANASSFPNLSGGGMLNNGNGSGNFCNPLIRYCTFQGNTATQGGAMANIGSSSGNSSPSLINCTFEANTATGTVGGAMWNHAQLSGTSSPTLTNCTFRGNSATLSGGAMYNNGLSSGTSSPRLANCSFQSNTAQTGGAIYNSGYAGGTSSPSLTNCAFQGNSASQNGGAMFSEGYNSGICQPSLTNCSFQGNTATQGGAMYNNQDVNGIISLSLTNCVLFGNSGSNTFVNNGTATVTAAYSLFDNTVTGYNNGGANLTTTTSPFVSTTSVALTNCSPAINAGTNSGAPTTDILGNARVGATDMGAYEFQGSLPTTLYVNQAVTASGDGTTWGTAFKTLQEALTAANSCPNITEIWVAKGTYYPTADATGNLSPADSRTKTFVMKNNLAIYGGFPNDGTGSMANRNWTANPTILSGEIQQDNDASNNSFHVILNYSTSLTSTAVLDGFTITGGNMPYDIGGSWGGGMLNFESSPSLSNITFSGNSAKFGGGMFNHNSTPSLSNVTFSGNSAEFGGGMFNEASIASASLSNVTFLGNSATTNGGGMFNTGSSPSLTNCSFSGNVANDDGGGGMYNSFSSPSLTNCTFSGNQATLGGGMYNKNNSSPSLKNCILWGNSSEVANDVSTPTYTNCLVQGLNPAGTGNLDGTNAANNPLFVNQPPVGLGTTGDLRLQACSPAINAGNDADNSTTLDLAGNGRKFGTIDMGAYEYQGNPITQPTASASTTTAVICAGSTINLSASGGDTYSWNGPSGSNFSSTDQTPSFTGSSTSYSGLYTVVVSNTGCTATATATVSVQVNPNPVSTPSSNSPICAGQTLQLSTTAVGTYSWEATNYSSAQQSPSRPSATTAMSGVYKLTVSNSSCTTTATISVQVVSQATASISPSTTQTICQGQPLNLTASGGSPYSWSGPNFSSANAIASINTGSTSNSGIYQVLVGSGVCTATATVSVQIKSSITVSVGFAPVCLVGNPLNLSASGGDAYRWRGPNSFTSTSATPGKAKTVAKDEGVYSVTVTGNGVCTATSTIRVFYGIGAGGISITNRSPYCKGGPITLTATAAGASSYQWTKQFGTVNFTGNPVTITNNAKTSDGGVYIVFVTGQNGCIEKQETLVTVSPVACIGTRLASEEVDEIDMQINAYPNPVTNTLTVEVTLQKPSKLSLKLFNSIGKESGSWQLNEESTVHKTELDMSELTGGVYLLQAQAGKQKVVKRVVKIQY